MFDFLINLFVKIIETTGYSGVSFLMMLESMILPVPSEAVMPFAGFLMFLDKMSFPLIIFFSTLGSIIGSLLSYAIGYYGGRPLVLKFGKYLLINEEHLNYTENFFNKYGAKTIFFSRFIPVIRHLISIPAGTGKMNLLKFSAYTIVGATMWNAFLTYLGFQLGNKWEEIKKYTEILDIILVILIVSAMIYFFRKQYLKRKGSKEKRKQ